MGNQKTKQEMLRPRLTVAKRDKDEYERYCRAPLHHSPKVFVALCDHQPRSYDEISLEKGEEMEVLSTARNSDVVLVRLLNGSKHGFVPFESVAEKGSYRTQEWFFGNISRKASESLVMAPENCFGTFIVRYSEHIPNHFAITLKGFNHKTGCFAKNYRIKTDVSGNYCLIPRVTFKTLPELISYYQNHDLVNQLLLVSPCPRPEVNRRHSAVIPRNDICDLVTKDKRLARRASEGFILKNVSEPWEENGNFSVKSLRPNTMSEATFLEEALKMFHDNKVLYAICEVNHTIN